MPKLEFYKRRLFSEGCFMKIFGILIFGLGLSSGLQSYGMGSVQISDEITATNSELPTTTLVPPTYSVPPLPSDTFTTPPSQACSLPPPKSSISSNMPTQALEPPESLSFQMAAIAGSCPEGQARYCGTCKTTSIKSYSADSCLSQGPLLSAEHTIRYRETFVDGVCLADKVFESMTIYTWHSYCNDNCPTGVVCPPVESKKKETTTYETTELEFVACNDYRLPTIRYSSVLRRSKKSGSSVLKSASCSEEYEVKENESTTQLHEVPDYGPAWMN